eukprot:g5698.t1
MGDGKDAAEEFDQEMLDVAEEAQQARGQGEVLQLGDAQLIMEAAYQHTQQELNALEKIRREHTFSEEAVRWLEEELVTWRIEQEEEKATTRTRTETLLNHSPGKQLEPTEDDLDQVRAVILTPEEAAKAKLQALPADLFAQAESSDDEEQENNHSGAKADSRGKQGTSSHTAADGDPS